jgi:hypothetical protein
MKQLTRLADWTLAWLGTGMLLLLVYLVAVHGSASRYVVLAGVALGLFAARWLPPIVKLNLVLVVVSTVVALYVGEFALSLVASARADFAATQWLTFPSDDTLESTQERLAANAKEKPTFDRRNKMQVIQDFERQGIAAYPAVFPHATLRPVSLDTKHLQALSVKGIEILPLGGISNVHTVFCNESGEYVTYQSDERGFHNPPGIWNLPQFDILAVGDSFTHGACVPSSENYVGVIREQFSGTVTLGMDSNGPITMLASLKEYGPQRRPKVVLWFYYEGNDLQDMEHEQRSPLLMQYVNRSFSQGLFDRQPELDRILREYVSVARQTRGERAGWEDMLKLHHLRNAVAVWYAGQTREEAERVRLTYWAHEVSPENMTLFRGILTEADSMVHGWGGQLYFVYLPQWERYAKPEFADKNRESVLRLINDLKLPLIDLHPVFAKHSDPIGLFPFRQSNHYNTAGHRLVGEQVLRVVRGAPLRTQ